MRRIRADILDARAVPVVAVTAFAMKEDRDGRCSRGVRRLHREADQRPRAARQMARFLCEGPDAMTDQVTVLAVDDQPQNLRLLDAVLSPRGYRVVTADVGRGGPGRSFATSRVDLVLLDILMPGMDGYEVCRRIRADPPTAFLPVVMITASGDQEKVAAIEAGADDFVSKPFNQGELLARVASLARVKRYHDTIRGRPRSCRAGTPSSRPGAGPGRRSSNGSTGCAGSCPRSSPTW